MLALRGVIMRAVWIYVITGLFSGMSVLGLTPYGNQCTHDDFEYKFTECDSSGGQWRVSIPKKGVSCSGGINQPPVKVSDCSVSCEPGSYFNVTDLKCALCPAGTYSLGGGVNFDTWTSLPPGFHARAEAFRSSFTVSRRRNGDIDCSGAGWKTRGDVLSSQPGQCAEVLVYSVKLVKPGMLIYTYRYTDESIIFEFQAQNEQCQSINDAEDKIWPHLTKENQWNTVTVQLEAGLNVLHWRTIGIETHKSTRPVLIKSIQISGVAYTSECSPCAAGTYSSGGSHQCEECSDGTFSPRGSTHCTQCNPQIEYAPKASPKCLHRPPCTARDYYELDSVCDKNNHTQAIYKWVEPQICREDLESSVTLPPSGKKKTCPPCNSGMQYISGKGCVFCPKDEHSDGVSHCEPCPPSTAPNYGYQYQWWTSMPPGIRTICMSDNDAGCATSEGWQPGGDHVHSGRGHADDAYLVLSLKVTGFRGREGFASGHLMEVGRISFTFELDCSSDCEFVFMEGSVKKGLSILQSWTGQQPRQYYSYLITRNDTYTFSWAFQKVSWEMSYQRSSLSRNFEKDMAKIFNINVTNTIDGGASTCLPCPQGLKGLGCIPCPSGHYIEENTTECTACPKDTVVTDAIPYGPNSCIPCGPGLTSPDGLTCTAKCYLDVDGSHYDFTNISIARVVQGSTLFTTSGTKYYHLFNISLCGDTIVTCPSNTSYNLEGEVSTNVVARTCRSTIVPGQDNIIGGERNARATQAVSLGDHLLGVTTNQTLNGIHVISEFIDKTKKDIHFFFTTPSSTRACPSGRSTTISLRCDTTESGQGTVILPRQCADGTCDGCNFHFLWTTPLGCPVCSANNLIVMKGECVKGQQEIHYLNPKGCYSPAPLPPRKIVSCTTQLPFIFEVAVLSAIVIALGLALLLFCLWKKNRNLEYKYMKLIASASSKDGTIELPPAESCALDDGEEDDIHFSTTHKSILNKFNKSKIGDSSNGLLESMKLTRMT